MGKRETDREMFMSRDNPGLIPFNRSTQPASGPFLFWAQIYIADSWFLDEVVDKACFFLQFYSNDLVVALVFGEWYSSMSILYL